MCDLTCHVEKNYKIKALRNLINSEIGRSQNKYSVINLNVITGLKSQDNTIIGECRII